MKVGFIGLGHMGGPMCRNIIKGGHEVRVHDLSDAAVQTCLAAGGIAAGSVAGAVSGSEVVMTSLPMPKDVETVALGPDGILENAVAGTIYVDLSTNSPAMMKKIADKMAEEDVIALDGPVSGGVVGAEKATIAIMVGGNKKAFDSCMPIFESFGKTIVHTGELGSGCVAKLVNNMIAFINMVAAAEGLMMGVAAGMDAAVLNEIVRNSSGNSMSYRGVAKSALERDFAPGFTVDLAYKDLRLALELADELDMPLLLGPQVHNVMRMARGKDGGGENVTAVLKVYEAIMKQQVGPAGDKL